MTNFFAIDIFIPQNRPSSSASLDKETIVPLEPYEDIMAIGRFFRLGSIILSAWSSRPLRRI